MISQILGGPVAPLVPASLYLEAEGGRVEIRAELRTPASAFLRKYLLAANERTKKHSSCALFKKCKH